VLDAFPERVDHAAPGDLALQAVKKLATLRPVLRQTERFGYLWLRRLQESPQFGEINGVLAVVIFGKTKLVTRLVDERFDN
jgi:hypothetical protein